jgi:hypothetical protein
LKTKSYSIFVGVYCPPVHHLNPRFLRAKKEPKMRTHFTDVTVQRLQKPGTYWDETTPGFGVRVGKNRKTWVIMRGQIRQRVRIGHYPSVSLADARKQAKKLLTEAPTRNPAINVGTAYETAEFYPIYRSCVCSRRGETVLN